MIDEILCALFVRIHVRGWFTISVGLIALLGLACATTPAVDREAQLNAAVRRVQVHEAAIEACRCAEAVCDHATAICDQATQLVDADLKTRCDAANHVCDQQRASSAQECGCD